VTVSKDGVTTTIGSSATFDYTFSDPGSYTFSCEVSNEYGT